MRQYANLDRYAGLGLSASQAALRELARRVAQLAMELSWRPRYGWMRESRACRQQQNGCASSRAQDTQSHPQIGISNARQKGQLSETQSLAESQALHTGNWNVWFGAIECPEGLMRIQRKENWVLWPKQSRRRGSRPPFQLPEG